MEKLQVLKDVFGHASFRGEQETVVDALLNGRDVLAVMPTGAGKSVCYQLPALLMSGITLVISPLISLMGDQVMALKAAGVPAAYLNSSLSAAQQTEAIRRASLGAYKLIYVAPERLSLPKFVEFARKAEISLIAVDEAHCVSQWGQDFRPSYTRIASFAAQLPKRPVMAAFTATATDQVRQDIVRLLELRDPLSLTTGFDRQNLHFSSLHLSNRRAALEDFLRERPEESGIVYCNTRRHVTEVWQDLLEEGFSAARYHAGLSAEERKKAQEDFQYDRVRIMVATNAFGMGIDKPNVRFVVHYNLPFDLESYYQEAGRAGRDGDPAKCLLMFHPQDIVTAKWMINQEPEDTELDAQTRKLLRERDLARLQKMIAYAESRTCLRRYLLDYFGETAGPSWCENCSVCDGELFDVENAPSTDLPMKDGEREERASRRRRRERMDGTRDLDPWQRSLFENLRTLRSLIAAADHVPKYIICNDSTLLDMVRLRPQNEKALLAVSGMGRHKAERFGPAFLAVIRDGKEPNEAAFFFNPLEKVQPYKREKEEPTVSDSKQESAFRSTARSGARWSEEEHKQLIAEFEEGLSLSTIAKRHQRGIGAIRTRLILAGLIDSPTEETDRFGSR